MNIWEVTFEVSWSYMDEGEFYESEPETVTVVADDYDSALETARQEVMEYAFDDDEQPGVTHTVRDARLTEIRRCQAVDAIAKNLVGAK